ncbi:MAG: hypothetical protein ABFS43_15175 [Thermodesulfobacteriota bacterium]
MKIIYKKITYLMLAAIVFLTPVCFSAENTALSASDQAQVEAQVQEMNKSGVPAGPAQNMLTMMHQHQFSDENIVRAQQEVMNCAKNELPTEPVMSKAMEGIAKNASEQQVITAMQTVHSRYAHAHQMAQTLSSDQTTVDNMTHSIADSLAAGMKVQDMETVMLQLQNQQNTQTMNKSEEDKLAIQTMQTTRTMARLGIQSSDVSDTVCQALQNNYSYQEMAQLRHQMANQIHQALPQQIAHQHANAIGKGGTQGGSNAGGQGPGGSGGGPGDAAGGNGSGSGGSGQGSGGSGAGGSGGGPGGSGSGGSGSGGSGEGSGGSGSGSN